MSARDREAVPSPSVAAATREAREIPTIALTERRGVRGGTLFGIWKLV